MAGVTEDYIHEDCRRPGVLKPQSADLTMHIKDGEVQVEASIAVRRKSLSFPVLPGIVAWDAALTSLT
jgi:hypothetical protein